MNTAIIVAAGKGNRLGSETPKQFLEINGKPVIRYSMERFDEAPSVDDIVVVVSPENVDAFRSTARSFGIAKLRKIVAGGASRAESVRNGLNAANAKTEIVAVHDAARPLVTVEEIERTIAAAGEYGAACLTAPVNDTIKVVADGVIRSTVDRSTLRKALTPQAFRYELLTKAFSASGTDANITDECFLVEKLGHAIAAVEGNSRNIKITYPEDLEFARAVLAGDGRAK